MTKTEQVIARLKPCNCGCHGQDPWHKSEYRRVVSNVEQVDEFHQRGTVRLPQSTQPVTVNRDGFYSEKCGRVLYGAWIVDRATIINDR